MTGRAMAARSGETGTGSTEGNSAVANGNGPQPTDNREDIVTTSEQQAVPVAQQYDWFLRNADPKNPTAFINTNPRYFAEECSSAIMSVRLASHPCKPGEGAGEGCWLPIETAPKNGSTFFARGRNWGRASNPYHVVQAQWSIDAGEWKDANDDSLSMAYLVEWYRLSDATQTREAELVALVERLRTDLRHVQRNTATYRQEARKEADAAIERAAEANKRADNMAEANRRMLAMFEADPAALNARGGA